MGHNYTSPTLAIDLFSLKTRLTGTLDKGRVGNPGEIFTMLEMLSEKNTLTEVMDSMCGMTV